MITLEEYTEEEKKTNGNMIKGGKIHDKICEQIESSGYKEPIINDISVGVWKAVDIITALKEELKREREVLNMFCDLRPKGKARKIYGEFGCQNFVWEFDQETIDLARETQKQRKIEL